MTKNIYEKYDFLTLGTPKNIGITTFAIVFTGCMTEFYGSIGGAIAAAGMIVGLNVLSWWGFRQLAKAEEQEQEHLSQLKEENHILTEYDPERGCYTLAFEDLYEAIEKLGYLEHREENNGKVF